MCEPRYNLPSDVEITEDSAEDRGGSAADCSKKRAFPAKAASQPSSTENNYGRGRRRDAWRHEFGPFVAQETGTLYKREIGVYDQKPREKPPRREVPLSESQVTQERANLREDLKKPEDHPARRTTLEGIYFWISAYMALSEEEKAELEDDAQRGQ